MCNATHFPNKLNYPTHVDKFPRLRSNPWGGKTAIALSLRSIFTVWKLNYCEKGEKSHPGGCTACSFFHVAPTLGPAFFHKHAPWSRLIRFNNCNHHRRHQTVSIVTELLRSWHAIYPKLLSEWLRLFPDRNPAQPYRCQVVTSPVDTRWRSWQPDTAATCYYLV